MSTPSVRLIMTDRFDKPIPGVGGGLRGVTGLSYTPDGDVLDGIGYVRFKIPMRERRNIMVAPTMRIQVMEGTTLAARAYVTSKSETMSEDGTFAQFDCPDVFFLLSKVTVTSGFATAPGESLATTFLRLLANDHQNTWTTFSELFDPVTGATPYDGVIFSAMGAFVSEALVKLAGERFSHVKRGVGLSIEFGPMGSLASFVAVQPDPWTTLAAPVPNAEWGTINLTSGAFFPTTGNYDVTVGSERMTVWAGQGSATLAVIRGNPPTAHNAGEKVTAVGQGTSIARLVGYNGGRYQEGLASREIDMSTFAHTRDGIVANDITPVNTDSAATQLTLRTLYNPAGEVLQADGSYVSGPVGFTGFNPQYPIYRRPNASGATSDGMDYFLRDNASIAANDLYMDKPRQANIAPVKNAVGGVAPVDMQLAAVALYTWGVSQLIWSAQPQETIKCSTLGYTDVRDFAGKMVHVLVKKSRADGTFEVNTDLRAMVLSVEVVIDDATGNFLYNWDLSTNGRQAASLGNLMLGTLDRLVQNGYSVRSVPTPIYRQKSQDIGADADLVMNWRPRNNVTGIHYVTMFLTLEGMVHTRADNGHVQDVVTAPTPHDVVALPADLNIPSLDVNIPPIPITSTATLTVQDVAGSGGTGSTSVTAKKISGSVELFTNAANAGDAPLAGMPTTTDGHYALSAAVGKAAPGAGTVKSTAGGTAGATIQTTHATSDGFGAQLAVATEELVYRGPFPTNVEVLIDGVPRFGPFNSNPPPLDLTPYVDQNAHEIRVKSPTNGAAEIEIEAVIDMTTLATTS